MSGPGLSYRLDPGHNCQCPGDHCVIAESNLPKNQASLGEQPGF